MWQTQGGKLKDRPCLNTHSLPRVSEGGKRAPERENNSASNSSLTHLYKELLEHILIMNKNIHSVRKLTASSGKGSISNAGSMTRCDFSPLPSFLLGISYFFLRAGR